MLSYLASKDLPIICDKPNQIFRYLIHVREAIKLVNDGYFLAFDGYILVREAKKLVPNAYILVIDKHFLVLEAMKLVIDVKKHRLDGLKLLVIANL